MEKLLDCPYCEQETLVRDDGIYKIECNRCYNTFRLRVEYVNDQVIMEAELL